MLPLCLVKLAFDEERLQEYLTVQELLEEGDDEAVLVSWFLLIMGLLLAHVIFIFICHM